MSIVAGFRLDLELTDEPDVSNVVVHPGYDLLRFKAKRIEKFMSCCPEPYPKIHYIASVTKK